MIFNYIKKIGKTIFRCFKTEREIKEQIQLIAIKIIENHKNDKEPVVLVIVCMGGINFAVLLLQYLEDLDFYPEVDLIRIKSYTQDEKAGEIELLCRPLIDLRNRNVIIVEDIIDKGESMNFIHEEIQRIYDSSVNIETAALIVKDNHSFNQTVTYPCFTGEFPWITGMGMDSILDGYSLGRGDRNIYEKIS